MPYMKVTRKLDNGKWKTCVYKRGEDGHPEGKELGCHEADSQETAEADADAQIQAIGARTHAGKHLTVEEMERLCPECAEEMRRRNVKTVNLALALESGHLKLSQATLDHLEKEVGNDPQFFTRCRDYVADWGLSDPEGFCARAHHEIVGIWPGEHQKEKKAMEMSLDQKLSAIRDAIWQAIRPKKPVDIAVSDDWWVREVYDGYAIVSNGSAGFYRLDYTLADDGTVTVGELVQVEQDWKPVEGKALFSAEPWKIGARNNGGDKGRIRSIRQLSRQIHSLTMEMEPTDDDDSAGKALPEDALIHFGGAVKALPDGWVGGYEVTFTSEESPDLVDEFFDVKSDLGEVKEGDCYFEHGLDPMLGKRKLGLNNGKTQHRRDAFGEWCQVQLDRRKAYENFLYEQAEAGKLGWSSGTLSHLVEREPRGKAVYIKKWPLGLDDTLTFTPCEPRNSAIPLKSYRPTILLEAALGAGDAAATGQPTPAAPAVAESQPAIKSVVNPPSTSTGGTLMPDDNVSSQNPLPPAYEAALKALADKQAAMGERIDKLLQLIQDAPALRSAGYVTPDGGTADPNLQSFGDFLTAIKRNDVKRLTDVYHSSTKALGLESGQAAGWSVPTAFNTELLQFAYQASPILQLVQSIPVNEDAGEWPALDQHITPTAGSGNTAMAAGVVATKHEEMGALDETEPDLTMVRWRLHDVGGFTYVGKNLNASSPAAVETLLKMLFGIAVASKKEYYILRGNGVGEPLGIKNAPCAVAVSPDTNSTFAFADAVEMVSRLKQLTNKVRWVFHQSLLPDLSTSSWVTGNVSRKIGDLGFGDPIMSEHLAQADNSGCAMLCDFGAYLLFEQGGLEIAYSEHYAFINRKVTWLFNQRMDGQPWMKGKAYTTGTQGSDSVDMKLHRRVEFIVMAGDLGSSGTLDFKLQGSADNLTWADISGKSITQLTQAGTDSNKQAEVEITAEELGALGYRYVRGVMTVGVATSDCGVVALAGFSRYGPASENDLTSVDEIVA